MKENTSNAPRFGIPERLRCDVKALRASGKEVLVGRVVKLFKHKHLLLLTVNEKGKLYPAVIKQGECDDYTLYEDAIGLGDIIAAEGNFQTRKDGHRELHTKRAYLVTKCELAPQQTGLLPENRFSGVKARQYYHTQMAIDPLYAFQRYARDQMLRTLRQALTRNAFVECTTPVLQHNFYAGGSRPFVTHMLDNDADMYLRVTSEIALKHLIAGGLEKTYEIGNYFRNGSVSAKYTTPFLAAEIYECYTSEKELLLFAIEMVREIQTSLTPCFEDFGIPFQIDFTKEIPAYSFQDYVRSKGYSSFVLGHPETYPIIPGIASWRNEAAQNAGALYKWLKNDLIKEQLQPVILTNLPAGNSPLIAQKTKDTLHRSYLVANGATLMEVAQGQNDAEQLQKELRCQRDLQSDQKQNYKRDYTAFLHACRFGLPPVCSLFLGLERMIPAMAGIDNIHEYQMFL